jgi:hypothetical protein
MLAAAILAWPGPEPVPARISAAICDCGLSALIPIGSRLHRPHCRWYRVPGYKPRARYMPAVEQMPCRYRTEDEQAAVRSAERRRVFAEMGPMRLVDPEDRAYSVRLADGTVSPFVVFGVELTPVDLPVGMRPYRVVADHGDRVVVLSDLRMAPGDSFTLTKDRVAA